jgi:hypothetical protein
MDDKGMDLKFYQDAYTKQEAQRALFNAELMRLNADLAKAKWGSRGGIRRAITNLEQQIRKLAVDMRKTQENITEQTLALQGIDQDSGKFEGAANIVAGAADLAGSIMGAGGLSGMQGAKQDTAQTQITTEGETEQTKLKEKSNMMLYLIGGAVALFFLMKKK